MKWMFCLALAGCALDAQHATVCEIGCLSSVHALSPMNCNAVDYDFRLAQGLLPDPKKSCDVVSRLKDVLIRDPEVPATGIYYVPERLEVDSQMATLMNLVLRHWEYTELNVDPPQQLNWEAWGWNHLLDEYANHRIPAR